MMTTTSTLAPAPAEPMIMVDCASCGWAFRRSVFHTDIECDTCWNEAHEAMAWEARYASL